MKELNQFPLARILVFLIAGILLCEYLPVNISFPVMIAAVALLMAFIVLFWIADYRPGVTMHRFTGFLLAMLFCCAGFLRHEQCQPVALQKDVFIESGVATVCESSQRKGGRVKVVAQVVVNDFEKPLDVLFQIRDSGGQLRFLPGDRFVFKGSVRRPSFPVNPGGFDYNTFLRRKHISAVAYFKNSSVDSVTPSNRFLFRRKAAAMRNVLLQKLLHEAPDTLHFALGAALLTGYDDAIGKESREAFSRAGAMHVLCVSGLHVGVIFLILNVILKALLRRKSMRWMRFPMLLAGIWTYAFITGLSPSVMRASVMLTFVLTGTELNRITSVYNSIAASALLLLLYNPALIFAIGFQLSYAAVIAIIAMQKPISALIVPKNKILRKGWDITAVSVAAQAGTFAPAAFYFHSFPALFLVTNLVVIPLASLILYSGIVFLALSPLPVIAHYASMVFYFLVDILCYFTDAVATLPFSVVSNIVISPSQVFILFWLMGVITFMLYNGVKKNLRLILIPLALLTLTIGLRFIKIQLQQRFIVYSTWNDLAAEAIQGRQSCTLFMPTDSVSSTYTTSSTRLTYGINDKISQQECAVIATASGSPYKTASLFWAGKRILIWMGEECVLDDCRVPGCDILVLGKCPHVNDLEKLLQSPCETVVCLNNKDARCVKQLRSDIPVWNTREKGAFMLSSYFGLSLQRTISIKTGRWSPKPPR